MSQILQPLAESQIQAILAAIDSKDPMAGFLFLRAHGSSSQGRDATFEHFGDPFCCWGYEAQNGFGYLSEWLVLIHPEDQTGYASFWQGGAAEIGRKHQFRCRRMDGHYVSVEEAILFHDQKISLSLIKLENWDDAVLVMPPQDAAQDLPRFADLSLVFQPVWDTKTHHPIFYESLLRLPDSSMKSAQDFWRAPLTPHQAVAIDKEIFELVAAALQKDKKLVLTLNLSLHALLHDEAAQFFLQAIEKRKIAPQLICEITETAPLSFADTARLKLMIKWLQEKGMRFALDDMGTGFCHWGHMQILPVDYIKLPPWFGQRIGRSETLPYLLQIIRGYADSCGKKVIIEGVEDLETSQKLSSIGVHLQQGYGLGRPQAVIEKP